MNYQTTKQNIQPNIPFHLFNKYQRMINTMKLDTNKRFDENAIEIIEHFTEVLMFFYDKEETEWIHDHLQGSLFLIRRSQLPLFSFVYINRKLSIPITQYTAFITKHTQIEKQDRFIKIDVGRRFSFAFHFQCDIKATEMNETFCRIIINNSYDDGKPNIMNKTICSQSTKIGEFRRNSCYRNDTMNNFTPMKSINPMSSKQYCKPNNMKLQTQKPGKWRFTDSTTLNEDNWRKRVACK